MMLVRVVVLAAFPAALALQVASDTDPCPFGYGTGCSGGGQMTSGQRDQVAKILGGILKNLSGKKALVQDTKVISKVSLAKGTSDFKPIDTDPCPFGYGTGCSGGARMTSGQRDQVAKILGGILKNLSGKKALVQDTKVISKIALGNGAVEKVAVATQVQRALQSLVVELRKSSSSSEQALGQMIARSPDVGCEYFGACGAGSDHPIDSQTKANVAAILEGVLSNLSSQK